MNTMDSEGYWNMVGVGVLWMSRTHSHTMMIEYGVRRTYIYIYVYPHTHIHTRGIPPLSLCCDIHVHPSIYVCTYGLVPLVTMRDGQRKKDSTCVYKAHTTTYKTNHTHTHNGATQHNNAAYFVLSLCLYTETLCCTMNNAPSTKHRGDMICSV